MILCVEVNSRGICLTMTIGSSQTFVPHQAMLHKDGMGTRVEICFRRMASVMGMAQQKIDLAKVFRNEPIVREWDDENHKQPPFPNLP